MTKKEVAQKVRERLTDVTLGGVTLCVVDADIYKTGKYWRVPVSFSRWPAQMSDFYRAMAEVEEDIQEREHLNILLATGMPLEEDEEADAVAA